MLANGKEKREKKTSTSLTDKHFYKV